MATGSSALLILRPHTWSLVRRSSAGVEETDPVELDWNQPQATAQDVRGQLDRWNVRPRALVVACDSALCVSATLPLSNPRQARQRTALTYALEPFLPWSAEDVVADFVCAKTHAFAVALPIAPYQALLEALETSGWPVVSLAPLASLALQAGLKQVPAARPPAVWLWGAESSVELWLLTSQQPLLWRHLPAHAPQLRQELAQLVLEQADPLPLVTWNLTEPFVTSAIAGLETMVWTPASARTETLVQAAWSVSDQIAAGSATSLLEFRREQLAPPAAERSLQASWRLVQVALLCFFMATGWGLWHWSQQLDQLRRQTGDRQADLFRQVFPEAPVPVGVRARLENEYKKLQGMRGGPVELPEGRSAIPLVERLLRALPPELRYRILEIRVEQGRLYVVGHVREHADADRIADALRQCQLTVDSPSTHRLPQQGVEFRISAQLPVSPTVAQGVTP